MNTRLPLPASARSSTRGRPSAERAADIDRAIHEAATALFNETGYENTSMEAIAARAKVSKGTLYTRHAGKDALFRSLLVAEIQRWSARAGEQDHLLPPEIVPRMRHHARILLQVFGWPEFQHTSRLLDSVSALFPDLVREWHRVGTVEHLDFLSRDLAMAAQAEGRPVQDWALLSSILLYAITTWYRVESALGPVSMDKAIAYADGVVDALFGKLPGPPTS